MKFKNSYFDVIILAGGESKRFGEDKCDHEFNGKTLLQRVSENFENPIIVTSKLRKVHGIQIIDNIRKGPVKGIELGLSQVKADKVFITGCDFPFITYDLSQLLCSKGDFDVTLVNTGKPQPLLACYKTAFLKSSITYCKRLIDLISLAEKVYLLGTLELKLHGIRLLTVKNVNSWKDLNFDESGIEITESKLIFNV